MKDKFDLGKSIQYEFLTNPEFKKIWLECNLKREVEKNKRKENK
jgi:hypothetical protein